MANPDDGRNLRLLSFAVGPETFVFDIMRVLQIVPYTPTVKVPGSPSFIEGVLVLRGEVIPVIDMEDRFFSAPDHERRSLVLVVRTEFGLIGLRVEEVRRILSVNTEEILPAPEIIHGFRGELFVGVIERGDEVYLLLDVNQLLSEREIREHESADYSLPESEVAES